MGDTGFEPYTSSLETLGGFQLNYKTLGQKAPQPKISTIISKDFPPKYEQTQNPITNSHQHHHNQKP